MRTVRKSLNPHEGKMNFRNQGACATPFVAGITDACASDDVGGSAVKQLADVGGLIAKGAKVLIICSMVKYAMALALKKAHAMGIQAVAYDIQ